MSILFSSDRSSVSDAEKFLTYFIAILVGTTLIVVALDISVLVVSAIFVASLGFVIFEGVTLIVSTMSISIIFIIAIVISTIGVVVNTASNVSETDFICTKVSA